ncbi:hypothetical protein QTN47_11740 [Danxiaibacter flavus]|uniref:Uncharacterized protein n=1 Tax=Danxiaibacter flavus TaxID=3049108 RepID=A0ABV3ZI33_9BACT|nr:hypothetical protein QNM32_11745 [Chitinophagaceae bacterium DXS]
MNGFFNHLISKQTNPAANISPRLKGRFESFSGFQQSSINEVAAEKESATPSANKSVYPDKNDSANIQEGRLPKQPDLFTDDLRENDATSEGSLLAKPLLSGINNDQINEAVADIKSPGPFSRDVDVTQPVEKRLTTFVDKSDQTDQVLLRYNQTNIDDKKPEHQPDIFSLQQNIQLTPQLEINMAVINAFKQLYKNEPPDDNITAQPSPTIKVNIGRIDVRAVTQQTPSKEMQRPKAGMSLDDFLKKKNGSN